MLDLNTNRYSKEISILRKEIPKYVGLSLIAGALIFIAGQSLLNLIPHDTYTVAGRTMNIMLTYALPLLTWHEFYLKAENKMSQMKQKIRDSRLSGTIRYTKFERFMNATMILHDASPLP